MSSLKKGDTIIEVILAITVFSLVAISAITLMNHGVSVVQRSLEITLARQEIDAQAEMLRYVYDRNNEGDNRYVNLWDNRINQVATPKEIVGETCPTNIQNGFIFVPGVAGGERVVNVSNNYNPVPQTYAKRDGNIAYGLSVQITSVNDGHDGNAYDAYIQACWQAPGNVRPVTIGTIVRLYNAN